MNKKIIFVTGGVMSGLGKGVVTSSIGKLLSLYGVKVSVIKLDPYLNVDPGTMNPYEHGEVFVLNDGTETDLDLGTYERFIGIKLSKSSNVTAGKIFSRVLEKERKGDYLGNTVQIVPHITDQIKNAIFLASDGADVLLVEVGGTVGDMESLPFLEAIRQIMSESPIHCMSIHLSYVPYLKSTGEHKTKPTQHSLAEIRSAGIYPSMLVLRSSEEIDESVVKKVKELCGIRDVYNVPDFSSIYDVPYHINECGLINDILFRLDLDNVVFLINEDVDGMKMIDRIKPWKNLVDDFQNNARKYQSNIAIVGKYTEFPDAYTSVTEALEHAAFKADTELNIDFIDSESLTLENIPQILSNIDGIIVPGGFGERGVEGMVLAAEYARIEKIPYFGLCLGMQVMAIEFARNVVLKETSNGYLANSTEFNKDTPHAVIDLMEQQTMVATKGATMRLGAYAMKLRLINDFISNSVSSYVPKGNETIQTCIDCVYIDLFSEIEISERHRHRYEFNNKYFNLFERCGMVFTGFSKNGLLVEMMELKDHHWMVGVQFHPEFQSRLEEPHPLFVSFLGVAQK